MLVPLSLGQPAEALAPVEIASTAPAALASRAHTALVLARASLDVLGGRQATITGRLLATPRAGLAGRVVALQTAGPHGWRSVSSSRTATNGTFRITYLARRVGSEPVRLRFAGDGQDLGAHRGLGRLNVFHVYEASWYSGGGALACGGTLTSSTLGVANRTLPCGTLVTLRYDGRTIRVPVVDRGPYVEGREFDLTEATKQALGFGDTGQVWSTG